MRRIRQVRLALRSLEDSQPRADVRRLIRQVRDNPNLEAALAEECDCAYEDDKQFGLAGSQLTDFLQWLLDHQDQVLAFIKKIIELFAPAPLPSPA